MTIPRSSITEDSPLVPRAAQYGRPSAIDKIKFFILLLPLPIILLWTFLFKSSKTKSRKRLVLERTIRYTLPLFNVRQQQYLYGTTSQVYDSWCRAVHQAPNVEEIGEGAKLLWIGERGLDKVIVYLHGGAFLLPPTDGALNLLRHAQEILKERGVNVSIVLLQYTLVPEGVFPTQLKQAVAAINHLMHLGVDPQNMQLIGDSAGGNLILQMLSHLVHPLESERVPLLSLPAPFKGAYLMSPWVDLSDIYGTLSGGDDTDIITSKLIKYWGMQVLGPGHTKHRDYIEANSAADDWWKGVDAFVDRVLISAGEDECLKNEIIRFQSTFDKFHAHTKLELHDGVHIEPIIEFSVGEKNGSMTSLMMDWLTLGFQEETS